MNADLVLSTVSHLSLHLPQEAMPKDTQGWLQEDWVDTGEALMSRYNFAAEQHFEILTPRFQIRQSQENGGAAIIKTKTWLEQQRKPLRPKAHIRSAERQLCEHVV